MSISALTDNYHLELEYSSFQLNRFLSNTYLNPGTRLQPIKVDPMVHIKPNPPIGDDVDPYISEVPDIIKTITWNIQENGKLQSGSIQKPKLCFIEMYSLDPDKHDYPNRNYWEQYFQLDKKCSTVAPNGSLFQVPYQNQNSQIQIQLQDNKNSLLFGYGVIFTVQVQMNEKQQTYYCRIDPIANIRSSNTGESPN